VVVVVREAAAASEPAVMRVEGTRVVAMARVRSAAIRDGLTSTVTDFLQFPAIEIETKVPTMSTVIRHG
jgi:hypothetical protein